MNNINPKTENLYKKTKPIDSLELTDAIKLMVDEQKKAAIEVQKALQPLERAINTIYSHLIKNKTGRLIYVGAGTSGRIGLQDGVELFPTFNWPKDRLDFIIAGGNSAITSAVENAEDNEFLAIKEIEKRKINSNDVVIGIAASGNTPFTCKVMKEAKILSALTIVISNNPKGTILKYGDINIVLNTKEEVIAGSTRLKAGTAQKICLNIISSLVMTKLGKVKDGYMINMVPTNHKLRQRKKIIQAMTKSN